MIRQFIYIRQSTGLSYQFDYNKNELIVTLLQNTFKRQIPKNVRALNKGRLLEIQQTLQQNNIAANEIIHVLQLSRQKEENGYIYISFDDKVHRIQFNLDQTVRQFKNKVSKQIGLEAQNQIILFNSIKLQNSKLLRDYELRTGDFLCMGILKQIKPLIFDVPQVIFPIKNLGEKRRKSFSYEYNINIKETKSSAIIQPVKISINKVSHNILSHSLAYGPSPLSEYDNQFKQSMQSWMKNQYQVIQQQFHQPNLISQNYRLAEGSQNSKIERSWLQSSQNASSNNQLKIENYVGLYESYHYQDYIQGEKQSSQSNVPQIIIPKITISRELDLKAPKISLLNIESLLIRCLKTGKQLLLSCQERKGSKICNQITEIIYNLQGRFNGKIQFFLCFQQHKMKLNQQQLDHILSNIQLSAIPNQQLKQYSQIQRHISKKNQVVIGYELQEHQNNQLQIKEQ